MTKFYKQILSALLIFAVIAALTTSCSNSSSDKNKKNGADTLAPVSPKDITIPGSFSNQATMVFDSSNIKKFLDSFPAFKNFEPDLISFYRNRKFAYAWYDKNGLIEPANNLFNRISNIEDEGITNKLPYDSLFANIIESASKDPKPVAASDLMLTAQYLAYAKFAWEGLSEKQSLEMEWLLPRKKISTQELLDSLIAGKDILEIAPVYRQYALLRNALKKYNDLKAAGGLPLIEADKKTYKKGDSSKTVAVIRQYLFLTGDIASNSNSDIFDSTLQDGVKNFEIRNGFKDDGIVNTTLIAEMNYPIDKRIEQIMVNMERSRWVPVHLNEDYLIVNIPEYKLHVYEQDSLAWSMNVVVGKDQHKTVVFNGDLKYIVFSPYWNVPPSILKNEILPGIKKNPNYLANHNMEWNGNSVRQKPGANNSLGLVKFLFPNSHNIYLHDSPAKSFFREDNRAFSHGCIRLAEPKKLATYLLRNDSSWTDVKISTAMNGSKEQYVTLPKTIPVFISYFTAWVDRQGRLNFRKDVYKRDSRLAEMMLEKAHI